MDEFLLWPDKRLRTALILHLGPDVKEFTVAKLIHNLVIATSNDVANNKKPITAPKITYMTA